ncbi:ATP-binding cassette domain-containing protein, partial [Enterococcus faecalis]|nr:ATP-binding cassette domain-containing protein [Enterococcus faecalis]
VMPALFLIIGIKLIINNSLSLGSLIGFVSIVTMVMKPILSLVSSYNDFLLLNVYFQKLSEVLTYEEKNNFNNKIGNVGKEEFIYRVNNVYYTISVFEKNILNGISFDIRKGDKVAIVGRSGSGKSTLLKLLAGLLQPSNGEILYEGYPLSNNSNNRRNIFYVNQNTHIFNETIEKNISLEFKPNSSINEKKRLKESMNKSKMDEVLLGIPQYEKTIVSENGSNFSGGQRQKIALARAFYSNVNTLLLDEPTSAMDNISEFEVFSNLLDEKRTVITVAHRISTVKNFDKIILMDNGEIVCIGKHEDLIENSELYRSLYYKKQQIGGIK